MTGYELLLHIFLTSILDESEYQLQAPSTSASAKLLPNSLAKRLHGAQEGLNMMAQKGIPQADTKLTEPLLIECLVIRSMTLCIYLFPMIAVFVHVWNTS